MKQGRNLFDLILDIILLLVGILVIYWLIKLILGGSPDLSQVNSALIIMLIGFLVRVYREVGEIKVGIRHGFINIKKDMEAIKRKLKI